MADKPLLQLLEDSDTEGLQVLGNGFQSEDLIWSEDDWSEHDRQESLVSDQRKGKERQCSPSVTSCMDEDWDEANAKFFQSQSYNFREIL